MTEHAAPELVERAAAEPAASPHEPAPTVKLGGSTLRFDVPDSSFTTAANSSVSNDPPVSDTNPMDAAAIDTAAIDTAAIEKVRQFADFSQLLAQIQQIQQGADDLARLEQQLTQRQVQLEHDERRFRLWANDAEAEINERKTTAAAHESAVAQRMADVDRQYRELEAAAEQLQAERQALNVQETQVKELGDALLEQHRTLQDRMAEQLREEREQLWVSLTAEWNEQRAKFEREQNDYLKDRGLLEHRLRFQQEHLEKTRAELECEQNAALHQQQAARTRLETAERQLQSRKAHLDRYRATLDEYDRALDRERELIARLQASISSTAQQEQQQYLVERQAWEDERRQQQAELRRQQEVLLTHTDHLETRRLRLEALRREVEETSHSTMELRFAVEDTWAQLQHALGLPVTQEKVDQARQAVARDFEQWQARLWEQRQELLAAERQLEQQRLAFQEERRTLTEWIAARDQELLRKEQQHLRQAAEQAAADQTRQEVQARWLRERVEAEQVIRSLLRDLMERAAPLPEPDASALSGPFPA